MLADDDLGTTREDDPRNIGHYYYDAFDCIETDPNNELVVAEAEDEVVGMLQLTFIPYLTYRGSWRCLIEGVRVRASHRGRGIGRQMFEWAIEQGRTRNCRLVQLTSNKQRQDAIRFYESLGFVPSHEGFKLDLSDPGRDD